MSEYIVFKIGEKNVAIENSDKYSIEPTLINKVASTSDSKNKLIDGYINYKGNIINVIDVSSLFKQPKLKKFDGLIFIVFNGNSFAIKFEGFYKECLSLRDEELLDVEKIKI